MSILSWHDGASGTTGDLIDRTNHAIRVNVVVTTGGGSSATEYAEDAAHVSGNKGVMALGVRSDSAASLAGTTGDYMPMIFDASGRLWIAPAPANAGVYIGDVAITGGTLPNVTSIGSMGTLNTLGSVTSVTSVTSISSMGTLNTLGSVTNVVNVSTLGGITNPVQVYAHGASIAQTPTVSTGAYTAGDAVGGLLTFASAARVANGPGILNTVVIVDDDKESAGLELWLYDRTFTATADNSAFDPTDADNENLIGVVPISTADYNTANDNGVATVRGVGLGYNCGSAGTSLYGQLKCTGAPTFTATSDLTVKIVVEYV